MALVVGWAVGRRRPQALAVVAGLGLAETTPRPLVLVLPFLGFVGACGVAAQLVVQPLLAGLAGGLVTAWVTFLPSFAFVFAGATYVERLRHDQRAAGALAAVTGAVVGVVADLGLWFAGTVLFGEVETRPWGPFRLRWGIARVLVICSAASLLFAAVG